MMDIALALEICNTLNDRTFNDRNPFDICPYDVTALESDYVCTPFSIQANDNYVAILFNEQTIVDSESFCKDDESPLTEMQQICQEITRQLYIIGIVTSTAFRHAHRMTEN